MNGRDIEKVFLPLGRMVGASKSSYLERNPYNPVVFNANILVREKNKQFKKIWHGDLDLNKDFLSLANLATKFNELYILREHDCRFNTEETPKIENFVVKFIEGKEQLSEGIVRKGDKLFNEYNEYMFREREGLHSINVDDLYQGKKYEQVELSEDLQKNFSWKKFQEFLFQYALDNFDKIESGAISCFHKELRDFFIKDVLKRDKFSFDFTQEIVEFIGDKKDPKDFLVYLYNRRDKKEHYKLLKICVHFDFLYVPSSKKTVEKIYNHTLQQGIDKESFETFEDDYKRLDEALTKDTPGCKELLSLFSKNKFGYEVLGSENKIKLKGLLPVCRKEAYDLIVEGADPEIFSLLNQVKSFLSSCSRHGISFSHISNCSDNHILIPWTKGVIF